jgi:RNA polymerase sigma factor (TIGR02999 family)
MSLTASQISTPQDFTAQLIAWREGDEAALERLTPLVYAELHRLAHIQMSRERDGHVLQTTALVNEAFLKLMDLSEVNWQNRAQFFGLAATLMRRILVDFARQQQRQKREGAAIRVAFEEALAVQQQRPLDLVALDNALETLAKFAPRQSRVVELRFFGGLRIEETAAAMGVSTDIVKRDWRTAKLWLLQELEKKD